MGLLYGYLLDGAMIPSYGYLFSWLDRKGKCGELTA